jgi:probable rRNA maturation factor
VPRASIARVVNFCFRYLKEHGPSTSKELVIVFLGKAAARKLNHKFRQKDYATDVLSFAANDTSEFGELVLCPEVLQRQAKENGHSFRKETAYMLIHGILHLLGYEHEGSTAKQKRAAAEMFKIQEKMFDSLLKKNML